MPNTRKDTEGSPLKKIHLDLFIDCSLRSLYENLTKESKKNNLNDTFFKHSIPPLKKEPSQEEELALTHSENILSLKEVNHFLTLFPDHLPEDWEEVRKDLKVIKSSRSLYKNMIKEALDNNLNSDSFRNSIPSTNLFSANALSKKEALLFLSIFPEHVPAKWKEIKNDIKVRADLLPDARYLFIPDPNAKGVQSQEVILEAGHLRLDISHLMKSQDSHDNENDQPNTSIKNSTTATEKVHSNPVAFIV